MAAPFLQLQMITRRPRTEVVPLCRDAIVGSGGWVTDYREFSNKTVCIQFEIEDRAKRDLLWRLQQIDCSLDPGTFAALEARSVEAQSCLGTLQVTLVHEDPDEKRMIPAVPG